MDHIHSTSDLMPSAKAVKSASFVTSSAVFDGNIDRLFSNLLSLSQQELRTVNDDKKQQADDQKASSVLQREGVAQPGEATQTHNLKKLVKALRKLIYALRQKTNSHSVQAVHVDKSGQARSPESPTSAAPTNTVSTLSAAGSDTTRDDISSNIGVSDVVPSKFLGQTLPPQNADEESVALGDVSNVSAEAYTLSIDASAGAATSSDINLDISTQEPKTIADLLSELQVLAQLIFQQLSQAVGTGHATVGANSTQAVKTDVTDGGLINALNLFATDSVQGILPVKDTAADAAKPTTTDSQAASEPDLTKGLSDMLTLALKITKQLEAIAGSTDKKTAALSLDSSPIDKSATASVVADIQGLLDSLKAIAALTSQQQQASPSQLAHADSTIIKNEERRAQIGPTTTANVPLLGASSPNLQTQDGLRNNVSENRGRSTDTSVSGNAQSSVVNLQEKAQGGASNNSNFNFDKNQQGGGPVLPPPVTSDARNLSSSIGNATSASPYNFASQLSFIKTNSLGATGLPPAVEQVIFQLNRNVKSGNDQLSLQLNPTELGRVNIKLNINADGKVHGTVVASNPATLDLLLKDVRSLERALQDAGLRADSGSLQFSLGGQGQSDNAPGQPSSPKNSRVPDPLIDADGTLLESNETYVVTPGRVNLRV